MRRHHLHPVRRGFLYLAAVMDWHRRKVEGAGLADIEHAGGGLSCPEALNEAIHRFGAPGIMNMEHGRATGPSAVRRQGSQFTSLAWSGRLKRPGTRISMDGKGRWITFCSHQRPHAAHGGQPPAAVHLNNIETDRQVQAGA